MLSAYHTYNLKEFLDLVRKHNMQSFQLHMHLIRCVALGVQ